MILTCKYLVSSRALLKFWFTGYFDNSERVKQKCGFLEFGKYICIIFITVSINPIQSCSQYSICSSSLEWHRAIEPDTYLCTVSRGFGTRSYLSRGWKTWNLSRNNLNFIQKANNTLNLLYNGWCDVSLMDQWTWVWYSTFNFQKSIRHIVD